MMGGGRIQGMIRVESVRVVETNKNYKDIFHALFLLDLIVSDGRLDTFNEFKITDLDIEIINNLFVNKNISSLDKYIEMTLKSFIKNKKQITINLEGLDKYVKNKELLGFFIEDQMELIHIHHIDYDNIGSRNNLISSMIFDIFPSTTHIIINNSFGKYIFDLFMFLEIICKSDTWKIIKIKEHVNLWDKNKSWLYLYHNKCSSLLESEYEKHGFTIHFESTRFDWIKHKSSWETFNEYLIICRL